ncbi:hypothetical protein MAPG_04320 [Magnaporthiopsis poae ATCC 64411]|uniref:Major facilitator superfamily (MFS) profile domain-containing protein n=1 Tax=Magnaporthiopsis poae (strain ATCC 64411 / 73-15) TaxID=644358 RepID=A0A0C4DWE4_MAGP6|nr:hypothetical protein MAPG_04320 [Magnaporthiopsis poae ATCC 64411]
MAEQAPGNGAADPAMAGSESSPRVQADPARPSDNPAADSWDPELERAFEAYVPGTEEERRLLRKVDLLLQPTFWCILRACRRHLLHRIRHHGGALNLVLNRWRRSSLYLIATKAVWGACVAAISTAGSREHFLIGRFFLGCIEAGMFSGALFVLTCWYKKDEVGKHFCIFATSGTVSQVLGGIMAGGIAGLDGKNGWPGWRWPFLVEGAATVFVAFVFIIILPDVPPGSAQIHSRGA